MTRRTKNLLTAKLKRALITCFEKCKKHNELRPKQLSTVSFHNPAFFDTCKYTKNKSWRRCRMYFQGRMQCGWIFDFETDYIVCFKIKDPPTVHSTSKIQPTTSPTLVFSVSASVRKKCGYERKLTFVLVVVHPVFLFSFYYFTQKV
jgi:hypothetical protein